MNAKYTNEFVEDVVAQYINRESVAFLCKKHEVPRSTVYYWIKQHQKLKSRA